VPKGTPIVPLPYRAVHEGTADYAPAAPRRTEGKRRKRPRFRQAIAAVGALLAAGAAVALWQVEHREMMAGGGEASQPPASLPAEEVGSYPPPALERPELAVSIAEKAATGPAHGGAPAMESTAMIAGAPSVVSSDSPRSSNAPIAAVEQPTRQSAATRPAGRPAEKTTPAASALPDIATLIARGDALLRLSDAAGARLFYARAAALGSAPATTAMAKTYDPVFLVVAGVSGVRPEARQAIAWYQRAMNGGDADAGPPFVALVQRLQQTSEIDAAEAAALLRGRE
jgi:TPR repeat protein